nr:MAG TPA: hypothetical protein [Caudoviricetes sp.]
MLRRKLLQKLQTRQFSMKQLKDYNQKKQIKLIV